MSYEELVNAVQSQMTEIMELRSKIAKDAEEYAEGVQKDIMYVQAIEKYCTQSDAEKNDLYQQLADQREKSVADKARISELFEEVGSLRARLMPFPCDVSVQCTEESFPQPVTAAPPEMEANRNVELQCEPPRCDMISDSIINTPSRTGVRQKNIHYKEVTASRGSSVRSGESDSESVISSADSTSGAVGTYIPPHKRQRKNPGSGQKPQPSFYKNRRGSYNFRNQGHGHYYPKNYSAESTQRRSSNNYHYGKQSSYRRYNDNDYCYNYSDTSYYSRAGNADMYRYVLSAVFNEMLYNFMPVF